MKQPNDLSTLKTSNNLGLGLRAPSKEEKEITTTHKVLVKQPL